MIIGKTNDIPEAWLKIASDRWDDFVAPMDAPVRVPPRAAGHDAPGRGGSGSRRTWHMCRDASGQDLSGDDTMAERDIPNSPIGSTAADAAASRHERSAAYRAQRDRRAPYRVVAEAVILGRGRKRMTQDGLGHAIGTTGSAISRTDSGTRAVAMGTLARLGEALDVAFVPGSDKVPHTPNVVFVPAVESAPETKPRPAARSAAPTRHHRAPVFAETR